MALLIGQSQAAAIGAGGGFYRIQQIGETAESHFFHLTTGFKLLSSTYHAIRKNLIGLTAANERRSYQSDFRR